MDIIVFDLLIADGAAAIVSVITMVFPFLMLANESKKRVNSFRDHARLDKRAEWRPGDGQT
jgi:hypothetical protein